MLMCPIWLSKAQFCRLAPIFMGQDGLSTEQAEAVWRCWLTITNLLQGGPVYNGMLRRNMAPDGSWQDELKFMLSLFPSYFLTVHTWLDRDTFQKLLHECSDYHLHRPQCAELWQACWDVLSVLDPRSQHRRRTLAGMHEIRFYISPAGF